MAPIISFVGKHNSGKTTLLAAIVSILERQGIKTAVVKHASSGLDLTGERDSDRLFQAGASLVCAVSPGLSLLYRRENNVKLETVYRQISKDVDLVISEGFKTEAFPKIEVLRKEISTSILNIDNVVARVADFPLEGPTPCFAFSQQKEIANFILGYFGL
ncbi:molybdopterin-guanine dinucleotide biosynthesis protein B [Syntrophomonas curvata]